ILAYPVTPTMSDISGNVLDYAKTTKFNIAKAVLDGAPPTVMSAKTVSTTTLEMVLSEAVTNVDKTDLNWVIGNNGTGWDNWIARIDTSTAGELTCEVATAYAWAADMGEGLIGFRAANNLEDLALKQDAKAGHNTARVVGTATYGTVKHYTSAAKDDVLKNVVQYVEVIDDIKAPVIGAPSELAITDVPNDNGGFAYFEFVVSSNHPGVTASTEYVVSSYEIYRDITAVDVTPDKWVGWAQVAAYSEVDADNKLTVIVPTLDNVESNWMIKATTAEVVSEDGTQAVGGSAKATAI
ncbi:unnamed protein product, partial [marine sediment metagenome]